MRQALRVVFTMLLAGTLAFAQATSGAQSQARTASKQDSKQDKKDANSKKPAKRSADVAEPTKAIAVHSFRVDGVDLALTEVTRTAPDVVTVKWEYRNKTDKAAELAANSKGWSDPYRLAWDTFLLLPDGETKVAVMRDSDHKPVSAMHGGLNQLKITVAPKATLKTWAKYSVPAGADTVTVTLTGADPFESVAVTEPPK